ncbi:MAG: hypothetical protein ACI94Y_002487 [Maribacter sp.]|jgi:hypothetical protein
MKTLLLCFSLISIISISNHEITWNNSRPLQWTDYKGAPNSSYHAYTHSNIKYSYASNIYRDRTELKFVVENKFNASHSWVRQSKRTASLLKHERLHFDISELHARKLRKRFAEHKFGSNYQTEINFIFNAISRENLRMQQLYDSQSNHSMNAKEQTRWERLLKAELNKLNGYKN